jgi:hypothetical protein
VRKALRQPATLGECVDDASSCPLIPSIRAQVVVGADALRRAISAAVSTLRRKSSMRRLRQSASRAMPIVVSADTADLTEPELIGDSRALESERDGRSGSLAAFRIRASRKSA